MAPQLVLWEEHAVLDGCGDTSHWARCAHAHTHTHTHTLTCTHTLTHTHTHTHTPPQGPAHRSHTRGVHLCHRQAAAHTRQVTLHLQPARFLQVCALQACIVGCTSLRLVDAMKYSRALPHCTLNPGDSSKWEGAARARARVCVCVCARARVCTACKGQCVPAVMWQGSRPASSAVHSLRAYQHAGM